MKMVKKIDLATYVTKVYLFFRHISSELNVFGLE